MPRHRLIRRSFAVDGRANADLLSHGFSAQQMGI
jgi:hypothetical protein